MNRGGSGDDRKIIVVKKKVKDHGGHHGGAWKVAYADFVTAMMAFFLVMWIMGMDPEVKDLVQGYFSNPAGFAEGRSTRGSIVPAIGPAASGAAIVAQEQEARRLQQRRFEEAALDMKERLSEMEVMRGLDADVTITVTGEGLRVELMETERSQTFFDRASAELKPALRQVLGVLGQEMEKLGNPVVVEGHTDARPFTGQEGYTNWELSVQRANAARRVLVAAGLGPDRIQEVRGHADRELRNADDPLDPRNRRISVLLPFAPDTGAVGGDGELPCLLEEGALACSGGVLEEPGEPGVQ